MTHQDNEKIRADLETAYHVLAHLGLDDHTYTHLSARSGEGNSYFIYPFGLRFEEVRAESLLHVSFEGRVLEGQEWQYNQTGYVIHSAIYQKRPDIQAIFHIHTPEIVAVSACEEGLMPASQWALHFYDRISYHDYNSLALDASQGVQMAKDLGKNMTMLLHHHGSLTCGKTIWEAMFYTYHLHKACQAQCCMQWPIKTISQDICVKSVQTLLAFEKDLGRRDWEAWKRLTTCSLAKG